MEEINIVKFGDSLGLSKAFIHKQIKNGLLTKASRGHLYKDKKYEEFELKYKNSIRTTHVRKPKTEVTNEDFENFENIEDLNSLSTDELQRAFVIAQTKEKRAKASQEELKYKELKGTYVKKSVIFHNIEDAIVVFCNQIGVEYSSSLRSTVDTYVDDEEKKRGILEQSERDLKGILDRLEDKLRKIDQDYNKD